MSRRRDRGDRDPDVGGLRHRIRYRFDNLLARGTWAALVWLGAVTLAAVLVSSLLLTIFGVTFTGNEGSTWLEDFWQSLLRVMDPGTMAGDIGWGRRLLALMVTVFGLLVAGTLIGIIASGVEQRIDGMRRGRSVVIESGHVVILGASDRLPVVVHQLVLANAGRAGTAIVVLADRDPAEMNEEIRRAVDDRLGSRVVFRSGDPTRPTDLELVRLGEARAVIVLAEEGEPDARAVKIVLAVGAELGGFEGVPVVVELADPATGIRLVEACGTSVHPIIATQAVARTAAFALRRPGLGRVVGELFDFRGCDIHIRDETDLVGSSFAAVVPRFAKARPIGLMGPDGSVALNPPPETRFREGDRLVVIADDVGPLARAEGDPGTTTPRVAGHEVVLEPAPGEEHLLVVGWNRLGAELLGYWATFAAPTSTVEIGFDEALLDAGEIVVPGLDGSRVTLTAAPNVAQLVDRPATGAAPTTIVLLGYTERLSVDEADARTLLELRVLHRRLAAQGGAVPRIVVELLDVDNVPLAELSGPDDHLVSQAVGSQFIAQLAEQPERRAVFLQLYAADGPSLHLVPADDLGLAGELRTADVVAAAYAAGLLAIGWRRSGAHGGELVLNPHESHRVDLGIGDEVVVVG